MTLDPDLAKHLGALAEALVRPDFAEAMLQALGGLVRCDHTTMTRYSRFSKPDYLVHSEGYSPALADRYLAHYYRFDPFYGYWRSRGTPGVVWLGDLSSAEVKRGRYVREFLSQSGISDEIGLFLPPLGGASVALFLERAQGRFSAADRRLLRSLYPLLAGLYRAHVNVLFGGASGLPALPPARPVLVTDAAGDRIFANAAWEAAAAALPELRARVRAVDAGEGPVGRDRVLHRARLDDGFRLAPRGILWSVETIAGAPEDTAAPEPSAPFRDRLTPRERDIVALMLRGHPTIEIARKLGLSRGTVKNHRRRIYYKLDITTERELFLMYVDSLTGAGAAGTKDP